MKDYDEIFKFMAGVVVKEVKNLQVDPGVQIIIQDVVKVYEETADK